MKCDETKPQCLRCQKFGRTCDGYAEPPPPEQEHSRSRRRLAVVPIQPRIAPAVLNSGPNISIHHTEDESRYFDVFVEFSARELAGYFTTDFWGRIVSQESHAITPIRYAAIAIGALNRSLESAPESDKKVNIIQNIDKRHHEYAVRYFLKAVQSLTHYLSTSKSPQTRVALISCLLFVCFETFQGSFISSCRQYYGGLTILRSYCARNARPGLASRRALPQNFLMEGSSTQMISTPQVMTTLQIGQGIANPLDQDDILASPDDNFEPAGNRSVDWTDVVIPKHVAPVAAEIKPFFWSPYNNKTSMIDSNGQHPIAANVESYPPTEVETLPIHSIPLPHQSPLTATSFEATLASPASAAAPESTETYGSSPGSTPPLPTVSRMQTLKPPSGTPPVLHNDFSLEDSFVQMFTRLDGTGEYFGMPPLIPPLMWDVHRIYHRPVPEVFVDYPSAQRSWDFVMDEALQFYRRTFFNKVFAPENCDPPAKIAKKYAYHIQQLAAFERAFQPVLDQSIDANGTIINPAAVVLTLYQKCTLIILAAVQDPSEMIFDSYLPEFQYVVRTCAHLVESQDGKTLPKVPRFSFEVGVVPPLHFTVMKCRDPIIRREAINILFSSKRQEGMWDGVLCARIGAWLISCEEEGLPPPPVDSPHTNLYVSPQESATAEKMLFDHSEPQPVGDTAEPPGGWEDGMVISDAINQVIGDHFGDEFMQEQDTPPLEPSAGAMEALKRRRPVFLKEWRVPEKNRVQITVLNFHIPERNIKFKCRRALPDENGIREEREIVLDW